jgi:hypothetical protein
VFNMNVKLKFVFVKLVLLLMLAMPSFGMAAGCGFSKGNTMGNDPSAFTLSYSNVNKDTAQKSFRTDVVNKAGGHCNVKLCDKTAECKAKNGTCAIGTVTRINGMSWKSWASCARSIDKKKYICTVNINSITCSCQCQCPQAKNGNDGIGDNGIGGTCSNSTWQPPSQDCKDARADAKDWMAYIQSCKNPPPKGPWICEDMSHKEASWCKSSCQAVRKEICRHGSYPAPAPADSIYEDCDSCMSSL